MVGYNIGTELMKSVKKKPWQSNRNCNLIAPTRQKKKKKKKIHNDWRMRETGEKEVNAWNEMMAEQPNERI